MAKVTRKSKRTKRKKTTSRKNKIDRLGNRIAWFFLAVLWFFGISYFFFGDSVSHKSDFNSQDVETYLLIALFGTLAVATTVFVVLSWKKPKGGSPNPGKKNR